MKTLKVIFVFLVVATIAAFRPSFAHALDCGLARIEPDFNRQNWDVTYCLSSPSRIEVSSALNTTAVCRSGPGTALGVNLSNCSCHADDWGTHLYDIGAAICGIPVPAAKQQSTSINPGQVIRDGSGNYVSCYTFQSLARDMGTIDVQFKNAAGVTLCAVGNTNVTPGNYSWSEYFDQTLETQVGIDIIQNPNEVGQISCISGGINTAIGCIDTKNIGSSIGAILKIAIGIGGGMALLLMGYGVFIITTSAGIPDKLNEGKSIITGAAGGLLFIILSVVIFQIIGVNILVLPGLK